jgi:hypothetical protein
MRTDKGKMALLIPTKEPPLNKKAKNDQNRASRAGRPPTQAKLHRYRRELSLYLNRDRLYLVRSPERADLH